MVANKKDLRNINDTKIISTIQDEQLAKELGVPFCEISTININDAEKIICDLCLEKQSEKQSENIFQKIYNFFMSDSK